jgi:hypothetical protein
MHKETATMKTLCGILFLASALLVTDLHAQRAKSNKDRETVDTRSRTESIVDRAGGLHNKSNIGDFFENRGRLFATRLSQGVSGEFPIGSVHEYIYRAGPYVGIPGNVIQARFTSSAIEWEATAGYHNVDSAKVAFSDKPYTWPKTGWPVKDASGKPVFVSNQDSYCAYNDSNNTKGKLGIQINQTGYAFSDKSIRDMIVYTFQVSNFSTRAYDSVYFGMYMDCDIGGYTTEYGEDRYVFDKKWNRVYGYDVDGWSDEWLTPTGVFGFMMMQTPKVNGVELGITDLHWCTYDDDNINDENIEFGRMASTPSLYASANGSRYFHLGANAPNLHFDDFSTQPAAGLDPVTILSSGPYRLVPGDTLKFIVAMIAGNTVAELDSTTVHAYQLLANNFVVTKPPDPPKVIAVAGDKKVTLTWDSRSEDIRDPLTGKLSFEGYRLYKSVDKGLHWDQIDRNLMPNTGADPVPLAVFDRVDGRGPDNGLQYSYVDTNVVNGFDYRYSVTGYSYDDTRKVVLESARGNTVEDINYVVGLPRARAIGRIPVTATVPHQTGTGSSKVSIDVRPTDVTDAGGRDYQITFAPFAKVVAGNLQSAITVSIDAQGAKTPEVFSLTFTSATGYVLRNLTEGTVLDSAGTYQSGTPILFEGLRLTLKDDSTAVAGERPEQGDSLVIAPGVKVTSGSQTVLALSTFGYGVGYSTTTGVVFAVQLTDNLPASRIGYKDIYSFSTSQAGASRSLTDADLENVKVVPNPYLVSSLYEQEFGIIRREPIRQIRFNNLPSDCTIYIFSIAGDKVQTIEHHSDNGTESWDMRAAGGREIAPGVYLFLVKTDTAQKLGRFAVIK